MKAQSPRPCFLRKAVTTATLAGMLSCLSLAASAQGTLTIEQIEQQIAEQRIALEEAIANREATAAKAAEVKAELSESEQRKREVEQELQALCEEQKELSDESIDSCIKESE